MKLDEVRRFALSLPEATEEPHFDMTSFRVRRKIFATAPADAEHLHVFVGEHDVKASVAEAPSAFEELRWGKRLVGVRIHLATAAARDVLELVEEAWRRKAPKRLVALLDADRGPAPKRR